MERRFALFLVLAFAILIGNMYLMSVLRPEPPKKAPVAKKADEIAEEKPEAPIQGEPEAETKKPSEKKPEEVQPPEPATPDVDDSLPQKPKIAPVPQIIPQRWISLGSADPADPYRMLVTLTNRGAAVARVELNSPRYRALTDREGFLVDRSGYLGRVVMDRSVVGKGCPVEVVGPGTPAAKAGLRPGDLITSLDGKRVTGARSLEVALGRTKPGQTISVEILRDGKTNSVSVTLGHRPLAVIRPENGDPLSFLLTLDQLDDERLAEPVDAAASEDEDQEEKDTDQKGPDANLDRELPGIDLREGLWEVAGSTQDEVRFRRVLSESGLEILKIYRLAKVPAEAMDDFAFRGYHLVFDVEIRNLGDAAHKVAYRLDGPNGLPIEGWWYANKVGRVWSAGLRDVVVSFEGNVPKMVGCPEIAEGDLGPPWQAQSLTYLGVDAQYFSSVLIPQKKNPEEIWFAASQPLLVGKVDEDIPKITNTSCRVVSKLADLQPGTELHHRFEIFAGPKNTDILAGYGLDELVYYGWFSWAAKPMVKTLHFFHYFVRSYGLAIILLTVLVRSSMYPLSRKQTLNAQKMQELQPEIKKLQEKYKKDLEARTKAQQELFRKHNYNPLSGCLPMFIQLPIFIALYRSLMVDIELRQAPLLTEKIRWCSNLAAPDMLLDWTPFMPEFITSGVGMFGLGPYFNVLPILTVLLFLGQQKMMMPPPADEQQAMQQNMLKYMMLFMGILFFKVASGLCIYFIASSLWGLAERKLLPKPTKSNTEETPPSAKPETRRATTGKNGSPPAKRKKTRPKR